MKTRYRTPSFAIAVLIGAASGIAAGPQERRGADSATPVTDKSAGEELIKGSDRPAVVKALGDYLSANEKKRATSFTELEKKLEKALKPLGIGDLLKNGECLRLLFDDTLSRKAPTGKGHVVANKKARAVVPTGTYDVEYACCVPKNYGSQNRYPLILALPPSGMSGEKYLGQAFADDAIREKYVLVAPTGRPGENWFSDVGIVKLVLGVLRTVLDELTIDSNQVFLDGTAEGAEDALKLASSYADFFAGVIARSGLPKSATAVNFRNLPIFLAYAADDPKMKGDALGKFVDPLQALHFDVTVEKVAGRDHGVCAEILPKLASWLESKRRDLGPPEIQWSTPTLRSGRAYWLAIKIMETSTDAVAEVSAKADRQKNRIEITTTNVYQLRVLLNDRIVDLDKPFDVTINGKPAFSGKRERSLSHALDEYFNSGDSGRVFPASVDLDIK